MSQPFVILYCQITMYTVNKIWQTPLRSWCDLYALLDTYNKCLHNNVENPGCPALKQFSARCRVTVRNGKLNFTFNVLYAKYWTILAHLIQWHGFFLLQLFVKHLEYAWWCTRHIKRQYLPREAYCLKGRHIARPRRGVSLGCVLPFFFFLDILSFLSFPSP